MKTPRSILKSVFRPLVRFCIRRAFHVQDVIDVLKELFVEEGRRAIEQSGGKVNVSRLSALSGLQRKDVLRILDQSESTANPRGLVHRVLGQWQLDARFLSGAGKPRVLVCDGQESEFAALVGAVSSDLNAGTILRELIRLGAVERVGNKVRLKQRVFTPLTRESGDAFEIVSSDTDDLLQAVEENVFDRAQVPQLHGRTEFDNIDPAKIEEVRAWLLREGSEFHRRAREYLAKFDGDLKKKKFQGGKRVALGTFSRVSE